MDLSQFARDDKFLMLALDHRESFKKLINPTDPNGVTDSDVVNYKHQIIEALKDQFSSLLLDTSYGLDAYRNPIKPYLLPLEKSGYIDQEGERVTEIDYSVSELKAKGASGAKLLIYIDPEGESLEAQIRTAKSMMLQAKALDFPFFLELVTYRKGNEYQDKEKLIFKSLKLLLSSGVRPDVFKLEYPGSKEACVKLTETIKPTPWVMLSGGKDFTTFFTELGNAVEGGAVGFLAGRSLWQEIFKLNQKSKNEFLEKILPERFKKLTSLVVKKEEDKKSTQNNTDMYDVCIVGGGPAGVAAGIYSARKGLKTLFITHDFGGQSLASDNISNWVGDEHLTGIELASKLEKHLRFYRDWVDIVTGEKVDKIDTVNTPHSGSVPNFHITTGSGKSYLTRAVILTSGSRRKRLSVPGEDQLIGKGVSFCATCDGPLFKGRKVAVIGAGNAGLEAVYDLLAYAGEVYLLEKGAEIRGDRDIFHKINGNPRFKNVIFNAEVVKVLGENRVKGIIYKDSETGKETELSVEGVFVEIGSEPNTEMVKGLVKLDAHNQVMINFKHATTSHPGIFAAGDVTDDPYKQNNIAAGDGVRAALAAYAYLHSRDKVVPSEA